MLTQLNSVINTAGTDVVGTSSDVEVEVVAVTVTVPVPAAVNVHWKDVVVVAIDR